MPRLLIGSGRAILSGRKHNPFALLQHQWTLNAGQGSAALPLRVFTDAAATTAATTSGQTVKAWVSAAGAAFVQSDGTKAPVLAIRDGRWVLQFTPSQWMECLTESTQLEGLDLWVRALIRPPSGGSFITGAAEGTYAFGSEHSFYLNPDVWSNTYIVRAPQVEMRTVHMSVRTGVSSCRINGVLVGSADVDPPTPMSGTSTRLYLNGSAYNSGGVWDASGTSGDIEAVLIGQSIASADAQSIMSRITPERGAQRVVFDGDSLTDGSYGSFGVLPGEEYPSYYQALEPDVFVINRGVWGNRISNVEARRSEVEAYADQTNSIYVLLIGRNDIADGGMTGAELLSRTSAHCLALTAAGYSKIYVGTQIAEADGSGNLRPWESQRLAFNTALRANYADFCTGVIDFAADSRLQDPTNTTYFVADQLHQTPAGHQVKAGIAQAAISLT